MNCCEAMANEVVKVYLPQPKDDGTEFVYCDTRGSFHAFVENVNSFVGRIDMDARYFMEDGWQRYRMLWIDEDYDNVLINSDYSLNIFLKKAIIKKVYIRDINDERSGSKPGVQKKTEQHQENAPNSPSSTTSGVHSGVQCDNCGVMPIVGFRYKCAQCDDYDLCMECEHKQAHSDHVMYRFPVALPKHSSMNRRFLKKMRHGCFGRQPEAGSGGHHEHPRRCGRGKRHGGGGDAGAFTNFYAMMCDLAEGMDTEDVENARNAANETGERREEASKHQAAAPPQPRTTPATTPIAAPTFQIPPIDPAYANVGVQVLKNFSEMFGKLMDPLGIAVEVDIGLKNDKPTTVEKPKETEPTVEKPKEPEATVEKPKEPETVAEKSTETVDSNVVEKTVRSESLISIASTSSSSSEPKPTETKEVSESKTAVESGWTMLDHNSDTSRNTSPESSPAMPQAPLVEKQPTAPEAAGNFNYAQLSQDLLSHIQGEAKDSNTQQQMTPPPALEQARPKLPSLPVVYHSDKKINSAVIAMMAMGFSNEGNWLTNLLVTVNGNIPKALEMLHPSR